jgi:signal transduction histidine kinase
MLKRDVHQNEYSGVGAGLAIVRKALKGHSGNIWAESIPSIGSKFYFTLPIGLNNIE